MPAVRRAATAVERIPGRAAASAAIALAGLALLLAPAAAAPGASSMAPERTALVVELTGTIDPATAGWIDEALEDAAEAGHPLVVVRLNTPGGLDESMRRIVRRILDARMPVVVYVAPDGARAASAGLFITMAGDVAAMAPQTNIGSATPVQLGGGETDEVLGRKIRNDAAAYVRALAEGHGRNADLAARMVRDAVNVTAREAHARDLIEIVAPSERELLTELDGFELPGAQEGTLQTDGLGLERRDMPLEYEIRQFLVNPTAAYLLMTVGLLGIVFELLSPGLGGPGVLGAVALVLGLYGSAQLPVTAAGIVLIALGLALIAAETQVASFGVLGVGGIAALVAGGLLLYDTDSEVFRVSVPVAVAVGAALGSFTLFAAAKAISLRRDPPRDPAHDLVGAVGDVRAPLDPVGQVYVQGALWRARAGDGAAPVPAGTRVRVDAVDGLTLTVQPEHKENP